MANAVLNCVWAARVSLSPVEKLVLLRLADAANKDTELALLGVNRIAADTGLTKQGALGILERLIHRNYVSVVNETSGRRPRQYRVNQELLLSAESSCGQPRLPQADAVVVNPVHVVVNPVPASGQPRLPIPICTGNNRERARGGWPSAHRNCLVCGPVCLHPAIARKYLGRFADDREALKTWAQGVCDRWQKRVLAGERPRYGDDFAFWAAEYDADFGGARTSQPEGPQVPDFEETQRTIALTRARA